MRSLKSLLKYAAIFPEMEDKYHVLGLDRLEGTMMTEGQLRHRLDKIMCLFEFAKEATLTSGEEQDIWRWSIKIQDAVKFCQEDQEAARAEATKP